MNKLFETGGRRAVRILCSTILATTMLAGFFSADRAEAHPHVFVDCSLTFEFDDQGLKGIRQKWWFDEMFATMILGDFDTNHDNKLSADEEKAIENGAFVNLRNFSYFTRIFVDGEDYLPVEATEFKPLIEDSTLVYSFFVPLRITPDKRPHIVKAAVFDETFYTSIQMDPKNYIKGITEQMNGAVALEPVPEMAYFQGQIIPDAAVLTLSPR
ncbi:DUF1007 family protein [Maridesulfovibrio sp. FT414]|uniref:DUF1007 family protein n=1 Tax=Maridesulfovibrio sp. FT414 TaxID=2979469 RepID=UPI003D809F7C